MSFHSVCSRRSDHHGALKNKHLLVKVSSLKENNAALQYEALLATHACRRCPDRSATKSAISLRLSH
eukprot:7705294-Prorocentrum_lima.AAC.1